MIISLTLIACLGISFNSAAGFKIDPYIVGGQPAYKGDFPFLVLVYREPGYVCGGTILNENWVMTAAHCVPSGTAASDMTIIGGIDNFDQISSEDSQVVGVSKIVQHLGYNPRTMVNDIALLQLSSPLAWTDTVKAGKIADKTTVIESLLQVSGWGTTKSGGSASDQLMQVHVPYVSDAQCTTAYRWHRTPFTPPGEFCAGEGGKDSCQGDSGGPIFNPDDQTVVGVVSYGEGCADAKYPGIYTKVSYYVDWINGNMG